MKGFVTHTLFKKVRTFCFFWKGGIFGIMVEGERNCKTISVKYGHAKMMTFPSVIIINTIFIQGLLFS